MIQILLPEISELKREQARSETPKITKNKLEVFTNYEIPNDEGIYFLFDKSDNLIYIGKSVNIQNRIYFHIRSSEKKDEISTVSYILLKDYKYSTEGLERVYIDLYKPKYNDVKIDNLSWITPDLQRQMTQHIQFQ